ncbi:Nn.00g101520.m01.CDS01, partial [Neocucurbitaria sp. VM-36]
FSTVEPSEIELPEQPAAPIQELGVPLNGLKCRACSFITVNTGNMKTHCRKLHELSWTGDKSILYEDVKVQSFFRAGGLQKYFIVDLVDAENGENLDLDHVVQQQLAQWKETKQQLKAEMEVMDDAAKTDKTGWFKRTGWLEHFKDRNLVHLSHQTRLPDQSEVKLRLAAKLTETLIEKCVKGLSTLARETRRWLRSAAPNDIDVRPLARLQNPESQAVYAGYIVKFVCYYLRIVADEELRIERAAQLVDSESDGELSSVADEPESEYEDDEDEEEDGSPQPRRRPRTQPQKDMMKDARELFCWKDSQKTLAIQLWLALNGNDREEQINALLASLSSFIFTTYGDQIFTSGLVHFLAVLGIDAEMERLRTAKNYSYMLAGVVYCVRVLGVEHLLPAAQRDEQTDEDREKFKTMRSKYLADGSYSPMSEMLSLLAYGKHVGLNAGNAGSVYWSKDKKTFYLNGRPILIERFCKMAQSMVADVEEMLWPLCWVTKTEDRFAIPLGQIVDDVTFTKQGMSFVSRPGNHLSNGLSWMLRRARSSEEGMQLQSRDGTWKGKNVRRYLLQVERFLELLLGCVHITSGQPGRGSEITTIRHRNGLLQDRNIFVVDGQIMMVVRYHKSQSQWDKPKIVPRFLPPRLGQVMAVYLAYVQPFYEYLTVQVLGGHLNDYVWGNEQGAWDTGRLTRMLKRETGKRLGVVLHTHDYRHTAVGIGREKIGESFGRGYQDEVGEVEEAEVDEDGEDLIELQNNRTTAMGVGNYSVPMDIVKHLSVRSIEAFRPLSMMWHCFLGVDDGLGGADRRADVGERAGTKRPMRESMSGIALRPKEKEARIEKPRENALRRALQRVLGREEVGFKSAEQEQAMHAVLDGQTPLVVVLPTGGGKSLLFTIPACIEEDGVTVVVVPYRALIEDLVKRIQLCGIDCIEWKHGETSPASVVVVSADLAGNLTSSGNFIGYAGLLASKGWLRRVVVDECHLIFTSSDWRPKLALLKNLRLLACPIVLLTATLPPVRESELASSMLVQNATYIRASTVRANTRYFVSWCQRDQMMDTAIEMSRRRQEQLRKKGEKGVVYCRSKRQCEELAEALGCAYYHAGVPDRAERVQAWLEKGGFIVATSALGTGVDFAGIVYILHVGMPWSMIDYAQESGRGGRGGETVDAVVLVEHGEVERRMQEKEEDIDVQAIGLFLIGGGCRRELMSRYLDKKGVSCSDMDTAGCDRCGEGRQEWIRGQQQASWEWDVVRKKLEELDQGCAICWLFGRGVEGADEERWKGHRTMGCNEDAEVNVRVVDGFRREVRDGGGSHSCRRCWVSQKYCATGESMENRCQWPNIVIPLAYTAMAMEGGQEIVREVGFQGREKKEYGAWLGKRHREPVWGEFFSNAMVVAIGVILKYGVEG